MSKIRNNSWKYRKLVKLTHCVACGFVPVHTCQLQVHHRDENRKNNALENLVVLCANCHVLLHVRPDKLRIH
jgi:predicted HNH restriction endonuclease